MWYNFLKPPTTNYKNYYEIARFKLTWKLNVFMLVTLLLLTLFFFIFKAGATLPTFVGVLIVIVCISILYKTRKYKLTAKIFTLSGSCLMVYTMFFFPKDYHFADSMWMLVIVLFSYFTLGKVWGTLIFNIQVIAICYYLIFYSQENLHNLREITEDMLIILAINFFFSSLIISYLIFQFIHINKKAENDFEAANKTLTKKNKLIEEQHNEKTLLLQEIHHRVKNNLQVITSLLRLQSKEITDQKVADSFKDSINRVIAMSLIHEKMYQAKDFESINLKSYLINLATDLINSYAIGSKVKLTIESTINKIDLKNIIPFALIVNELVNNSIKHAFNNIPEGKITMTVSHENELIFMTYEDNGKWKSPKESKSFGMELIEILTEQMNGSFELENSVNTYYKFKFKDLKYS